MWFAWKFLSLWYQTQLNSKILFVFSVVICLKISIFVVSNTTNIAFQSGDKLLWFAWKFLSLWYQTQLYSLHWRMTMSCDLLENFYLCGIKHNLKNQRQILKTVVICLKISIFVVSNTTSSNRCHCLRLLWFAWKFLSLWYQTQHERHIAEPVNGCDLLENFYLCGIKHNPKIYHYEEEVVVICLKISIFVVSNTTGCQTAYSRNCCDLLENFYLCGIKHNLISVICLIIAIYRDT